jgi:exo-beta-1,3-glucanase (GH17 family)
MKAIAWPLGLFAAAAIVAIWWWLGRPIVMPPGALGAAEKLQCVSYAPFRADQNPLAAGTHVEAWQIEEDLTRLAPLTNCIRTYSIEHGVDQVPAIAQRHGMKVLLGLWLSSHRDKNRVQIDTAIALAKRYPDVVTAVIVGNEVLLRGELSAGEVAAALREVKAAVSMPVTYADVWEFWLRNPDLAGAVDFITIHLLPYWEDFPIPADQAPAHVDSIRRRVAERFPGKEIFIGEVGWPSAGRMREGALPSPANQARFLQQVMANARRDDYRVNVIEAFDQPWKRTLEGTVGGHWGLFDAVRRALKFSWGAPVSNYPMWRWQAAGGVIFALLVFGAAGAMARRAGRAQEPAHWIAVASIALVSGTLISWTIANVAVESLGIGGWLRSLAWAAVALVAPLVSAAALIARIPVPRFDRLLGRPPDRPPDPLTLMLGAALLALTVLALQIALMLVFDPRYVDFPFAPLVGAAFPFAVLATLTPRAKGAPPAAETLAAAMVAGAAVYIALNESVANWQALLLCAGLALTALTLARQRAAPG